LINLPIPVSHKYQQTTFRPFYKHRELFYPEALLGYADLGILQVGGSYTRVRHLDSCFHSAKEFQTSLAEFAILVALRMGEEEGERQLYPGYRLLNGFQDACARIISKIFFDSEQASGLASIFDTSAAKLKEQWPELAAKANSADHGSRFLRYPLIPSGPPEDD